MGELLGFYDRDGAAAMALGELHRPRALGEDGVVAAEAGAVARLEAGAALANDDLAAVTVWPAKTFTPRRLALESRPLREEPSPFL